MANFRIKVEALNPDVKVDKELLEGLECDGYFLVGHSELSVTETCDTVAINEMSRIDMATAIAKSTELLEAAIIAHGMEKARSMVESRKKPTKALDLVAEFLKG